MKKRSFLSFLLILLITVSVLCGCGNAPSDDLVGSETSVVDDVESSISDVDKDSIIGTWNAINISNCRYITFEEDGTGVFNGGHSSVEITWSVENNRITVIHQGETVRTTYFENAHYQVSEAELRIVQKSRTIVFERAESNEDSIGSDKSGTVISEAQESNGTEEDDNDISKVFGWVIRIIVAICVSSVGSFVFKKIIARKNNKTQE